MKNKSSKNTLKDNKKLSYYIIIIKKMIVLFYPILMVVAGLMVERLVWEAGSGIIGPE